ncbi:hypothetical protein AtNW77_Chr2g0260151 [Arabidopsis thaliana]|uniref:Uncharacterized protein n=4 Tax=Arabidopsis TaxID=3701 RepID=A0A654F017_ARATH|nr:uncharacterized protein AT2G38646 [Arabidopsis thaliana]KAG7638978.1 hypothetical protein ISN45_At02g033550 [Arabidopsis thaliana x Arabidopsis arenosa]KAG7643576.1 hypothetical protein ISN44_As02g033740 [Arabidopsis suecica]AEC09561.1 hypothetical protein AT2G38646 [Arabidopsis thaliana]CAA0375507.1 unnamed protein product [Arabidopsis thaliana]VYS54873.1 unnamed protein product [Arabidopsis thaliana]|eukprot:NP_001118471.1 hypothetical protein AT2G38646 [Arabidopsis thaliana]
MGISEYRIFLKTNRYSFSHLLVNYMSNHDCDWDLFWSVSSSSDDDESMFVYGHMDVYAVVIKWSRLTVFISLLILTT